MERKCTHEMIQMEDDDMDGKGLIGFRDRHYQENIAQTC